MALDPLEWIIIGVIAVVILLWGPKKIPEFARSIGLARKEFDQARKEMENPTNALIQAAGQSSAPAPAKSADDVILETARKIGISTEGKTRQQISDEIVAKTKSSASGA